jgi:bifunctional ADP-heptose synthase (sugar kinase/adenylyltransferase)
VSHGKRDIQGKEASGPATPQGAFPLLGAPPVPLPPDLAALLDQARRLRILLVGDTIIDRYTFVRVLGLTSKNHILSSRRLHTETHPGGVLAIYRHLRALGCQPLLLSRLGTEPYVTEWLGRWGLWPNADRWFALDPDNPTTLKQRFVQEAADRELQKLFATSVLPDGPLPPAVDQLLLERARQALGWADVAFVIDFGHGAISPDLADLLQAEARQLALNCQTNSANRGFNIINRRYHRADIFTLDQNEMDLAMGAVQREALAALADLMDQMNSHYAWLTRGQVETIGLHHQGDIQLAYTIPALATQVVDSVGAGDAFFSVAALLAAVGAGLEPATCLAQVAGAQATQVVGNRHPLSLPGLGRDWDRLQPALKGAEVITPAGDHPVSPRRAVCPLPSVAAAR